MLQSQTRFVSQFRQRLLDRRQVTGPDQQIEVGKLAHRDVAVQRLRQHRPFVRQHFQATSLQMAMNVEQLECQPQSAVRVGFVLLTKRFQSGRVTGIHFGGQPAKNQRHQSMMLRQLNQPLPIHAVPKNLLDTRGKAAVESSPQQARIKSSSGLKMLAYGEIEAGSRDGAG